jgi:hypothetical protein
MVQPELFLGASYVLKSSYVLDSCRAVGFDVGRILWKGLLLRSIASLRMTSMTAQIHKPSLEGDT